MTPKSVLPNMLLAGAAKSGTTSLWAYLHSHPEIYMCPRKELWFFLDDDVWSRGLEWYSKQFEARNKSRIVGEATPLYMYSEKALERIAKTVPNAKLIFILRNPVERAISHYWHNIRKFKEDLSFEMALHEEMEAGRRKEIKRGSLCYYDLGRYFTYLQRWYDFFPRENIEVIIFEEMVSDHVKILNRIFKFIGVETQYPSPENSFENRGRFFRYRWMKMLYSSSQMRNVLLRLLPNSVVCLMRDIRERTAWSTERPPMDRSVTELLTVKYQDEIASLQQLLGRDLAPWWK